MRTLVAGGTGFLGRHISRALMGAGHDVTVMTRDPNGASRIPALAGAGAVRGDVTDPSSIAGVMDGFEAVVAAIGFPNYPMEQPRKGLTFDRYERQGTETLVAEARRAGVGRYLYISGVGADPASPRSWYRAKGRAETALRDGAVSHSILRPSWAYGPEDRALNRFAQMARRSPIVPKPARFGFVRVFKRGPLRALGFHAQRIQPVSCDDIALAAARIFETEDAWGQTLEIGGPQVMTMDEVIRTMLDVMGKRRLIVPIPAGVLKAATLPLTLLPKPPMSPGGIDFATQDGVADTTALERVLDVHPKSLREGLSRYLTG